LGNGLTEDVINGAFGSLGSLFIVFSIVKTYKHKEVKGVDWRHPTFFAAWGLWNLYYYPCLGQWVSFCGGVATTIANLVWISQLLYYANHHKDTAMKKEITLRVTAEEIENMVWAINIASQARSPKDAVKLIDLRIKIEVQSNSQRPMEDELKFQQTGNHDCVDCSHFAHCPSCDSNNGVYNMAASQNCHSWTIKPHVLLTPKNNALKQK
jgi:hypothetical protein